MCLLIVLHQCHADAPLIVAANRDELYARPAVAMTVLQDASPRIVGGRDAVAGGTWLAANQHGVVAGLTNQPISHRDPSVRSRGELPLALAQHATASAALSAFVAAYRPIDFSPAWLLVGDRDALFYIDMTSGETASHRLLSPGLHVLENQPVNVDAAKTRTVRAALQGVLDLRGDALIARLTEVLSMHQPDAPVAESLSGHPPELDAPCVHYGVYGTRSSAIYVVPTSGPMQIWSSEGPTCTHRWTRADTLLSDASR